MSNFWLSSIKKSTPEETGDYIVNLIVRNKVFAVSNTAANRNKMNVGDRLCVYASTVGIVAHGLIGSVPTQVVDVNLYGTSLSVYAFRLEKAAVFTDNPVAITLELRKQLDGYRGKRVEGNWGWFFQGNRNLTEHDFRLLTRL